MSELARKTPGKAPDVFAGQGAELMEKLRKAPGVFADQEAASELCEQKTADALARKRKLSLSTVASTAKKLAFEPGAHRVELRELARAHGYIWVGQTLADQLGAVLEAMAWMAGDGLWTMEGRLVTVKAGSQIEIIRTGRRLRAVMAGWMLRQGEYHVRYRKSWVSASGPDCFRVEMRGASQWVEFGYDDWTRQDIRDHPELRTSQSSRYLIFTEPKAAAFQAAAELGAWEQVPGLDEGRAAGRVDQLVAQQLARAVGQELDAAELAAILGGDWTPHKVGKRISELAMLAGVRAAYNAAGGRKRHPVSRKVLFSIEGPGA